MKYLTIDIPRVVATGETANSEVGDAGDANTNYYTKLLNQETMCCNCDKQSEG